MNTERGGCITLILANYLINVDEIVKIPSTKGYNDTDNNYINYKCQNIFVKIFANICNRYCKVYFL